MANVARLASAMSWEMMNMKGRIAKIGGRARGNTEVTEEQVSIEYIELTMVHPCTKESTIALIQTNCGVVERASKHADGLLGMDSGKLAEWITTSEMMDGFTVTKKILFGTELLRISHPVLDAQLVHKIKEEID